MAYREGSFGQRASTENVEDARRALKARYISMLIEKAATSDDEKLLDRIETRLREYAHDYPAKDVRP